MGAKKFFWLAVWAASFLYLTGCVAVPPLINVTHKTDEKDITRRLDAIDARLNQIEKRLPPPQ